MPRKDPERRVEHDERWEEVLGRYLAGEIDPEVQSRVEEHLTLCSECADLVSTGQKFESMWEHLAAVEPSTTVWSRIMIRSQAEPRNWVDRIRELAAHFAGLRVVGIPGPALATVILLLTATALYFARPRSSGQTDWRALLDRGGSPVAVERPGLQRIPEAELPNLFEAAQVVLSEAEVGRAGKVDPTIPLKSRIVAERLAEIQSDPVLVGSLGELLSDVEIALTELSATARDPNPQPRLRQVREFVAQKSLLTRLAVARARLDALLQNPDLPPEIVEAYLKPPQ